jgi:hypothetical protein
MKEKTCICKKAASSGWNARFRASAFMWARKMK